MVPLWLPVLVIGALSALFWYRSRGFAPGRCDECGYNLTGNVSGVYSECGTPIETK